MSLTATVSKFASCNVPVDGRRERKSRTTTGLMEIGRRGLLLSSTVIAASQDIGRNQKKTRPKMIRRYEDLVRDVHYCLDDGGLEGFNSYKGWLEMTLVALFVKMCIFNSKYVLCT
ncbi:uncharacterized protein LOC132300105 isoform X2 [Cornus florida]|uniref:uncharacterized protein LOC132300105 isoform X2 n=1 Tax=Cornus florida TaxID=4283 RepID=UPI0028A0E445|nr:uncharacterized protein LOC132300105 isoform X2 [Cornus florida]